MSRVLGVQSSSDLGISGHENVPGVSKIAEVQA
jgi:hypothetical protein